MVTFWPELGLLTSPRSTAQMSQFACVLTQVNRRPAQLFSCKTCHRTNNVVNHQPGAAGVRRLKGLQAGDSKPLVTWCAQWAGRRETEQTSLGKSRERLNRHASSRQLRQVQRDWTDTLEQARSGKSRERRDRHARASKVYVMYYNTELRIPSYLA